MSDRTRAARRAVEDFRRQSIQRKDPSPWQLVRWVEALANDIERGEER